MSQVTSKRAFKLRTRLSFEELDSIVAEYARRPYAISLGGLDSSGSILAKFMIIRFEESEDCERLRLFFARRLAPMQAANTSAQATIRPGALRAGANAPRKRTP